MKLQAHNRLVTTIFKNPNHWNFKTTIAPTQVAMQQGKDYCLFGAPMPSRQFNNGSYRYGFNGQEKDDEIAGAGNIMTAEFWEYDPRLGRRWNTDPVVKPHESSYAAFANNQIWLNDYNGADTSFTNDKTRKSVLDIVNPDSKNYNKNFAKHFQSLVDDKNSVFNFNQWENTKSEGTRIIFSSLSANGRNDKNQNLIDIGFSLEKSVQGHIMGALFEETDHAVQFQKGRLGFFESGNGVWTTSASYYLNDEIDNKIWTANALNFFNENSDYKKNFTD